MNKKRPVNLDLLSIKQPLPAIVSISHRASGVMLFVGLAFMFYLFDLSLSSREGFHAVQDALQTRFFVKLIAWGLLVALAFHLFAGVKHLLQDVGIGEEWQSAVIMAWCVIGGTVIAAILAGVWIW